MLCYGTYNEPFVNSKSFSFFSLNDILPPQKTNGLTAMAALELRQQDILKQLAALKKQMQALKADLKSSPFVNTRHSPAKTVATTPTEDLSKHPDVVINASPSFPPYSLQLLQELWRGSLGLKVKTHLHSSVKDVPEDVVEFGSALEGFQSGAKAVLNVRLIWKDGTWLLIFALLNFN